jgi:mono/diheme cytochrome c family protein
VALIGALLAGRQAARRKKSLVPIGLRPGPTDEELERRSLIRNLAAGAIVTVFFAVFFPLYFLHEPARIASMQKFFDKQAVDEGAAEFGPTGDPTNLKAVGCANCHGTAGEGGLRQFLGHSYAEPPLRYIVARYKAAGRNDDDIKLLIRDAIERGRPGTPMPTWGLAYGGPLNSQQIDFLVAYITSIQQTPPVAAAGLSGKDLFAQNCAVCHGTDATGGTGPNLTVEFQRLTEDQVRATILAGRLNTNRPSMPAWAFLGKDAVNALVEFLKSIQRIPVK